MLLFLSLLPLSCMVVLKRKLANTLFPFDSCTLFNLEFQHNINMDMEIDNLKDWSTKSSINNSRESLVQSSVSSIPYIERMEAQNNNSL